MELRFWLYIVNRLVPMSIFMKTSLIVVSRQEAMQMYIIICF